MYRSVTHHTNCGNGPEPRGFLRGKKPPQPQCGTIRSGFLCATTGSDMNWDLREYRVYCPYSIACFAALPAGAILVTVRPNWGHGRHGTRILDVEAMPVRPGNLVVSVDDAPMAYLVPLMPPDIRAIGLASNFVRPGHDHGMMRRIRAAIAEHGDGAIWSVGEGSTPPATRDRVLAAYNLELDGACIMLRSSFEPAGHQFCPVRKRS